MKLIKLTWYIHERDWMNDKFVHYIQSLYQFVLLQFDSIRRMPSILWYFVISAFVQTCQEYKCYQSTIHSQSDR